MVETIVVQDRNGVYAGQDMCVDEVYQYDGASDNQQKTYPVGMTFDENHSFRNIGVTIKSKTIGEAVKKKITGTVPYMNGSWDFSLIYGEQAYEDRKLQYVFNVIADDREDLHYKKMKMKKWLMKDGRHKLVDDDNPNFYFLAECVSISFKQQGNTGELTADFTAYPFMICRLPEGYWDTFYFEWDYLIDKCYDVKGELKITLSNSGDVSVIPTVTCSSEMTVLKDGVSYKFSEGKTKSNSFMLKKGLTDVVIKGHGTIDFEYYKELL